MEGTKELITTDEIRNKVYIIRGQQVMLDRDLAEIYGYEVKKLNQQVKRNIERFPEDFMFQLATSEIESVRSQIVTSRKNDFFAGQEGGRRYLPYAFTEQGIYMLMLSEWGYGFLTKTLKINKYFVIHVVIIGLLALPLLAFLLVNRGILPEFSIGPFSVYVMTDFRVNEIASSFRDILYNFKNLLYLLYRQDIGRPYDVIMPFGFFGITARVLIFLGVFLLVIRLILALQKRQTTLLWMIFFQLTGALLLGLLVTVGMTQINCIYIPLVLCGALCVSSLTDFLGKKVNFYGKIAVSILLAALLLGENVQFEKAYFTSYKELVSAYFQEGSEEAVQKAMEIAAESGREIEIEDAIKYPSVLLYGEIDAAEYLANRNLSDAPPKPESFLGKGIRFTMGIDWEHIDRNKIYIIYYTDAEKFDGFALLPCRDWYVAY